ncbi:MAG: response regulator [bacterium]|nr:response regulator [bacterium]
MEKENNILIVDDDEGTCKSLKLIFDNKGYKVDTAISGESAIKKMRNKLFNIAVLDIKLPDIEGVDLISSFKRTNPGIAIIIVTAYASLKTAMRAINEGANAYITKPINIYELLDKIKELLENQKKQNLMETEYHKLIKYKQTKKELLEERKKIENLKMPYKLYSAIKYIKQNYENPRLHLKDIASAVEINLKSLSRLWESYMELSPKDFLNNIRIEKATNLLIKTDLPISKVAKKSGFSKEYFCIVFKAKTQQTPMKYRKSHSNKRTKGTRKEP